jgi:hypothetical protein
MANVAFFAGPEGRTSLMFSTGVRPGDLTAQKGSKPRLEATVMVRLRSRIRESMPVVLEQELRPGVGPEFMNAAAEDRTLYLSYNGRLDIPPGPYSLKIVVRDDRSGRMGSLERILDAPGFSGSSIPSSFLLTRQAQAREDSPWGGTNGEEPDPDSPDDPLSMGDLRLMQEPVRVIRQGHVVYCAYHLYNAAEEDFAAAAQGMQLGLLRGEEWVGPDEVTAGGQPFPDLENGVIRFVGWVDTDKLRPGRYALLAVLPNHEQRTVPNLVEEFEVLAK